uniref:Uncharacterized protein n=1 Tax=Taeniopygia guttata TaxID=59729 RepID=A0A674H3T2_TAEGU
MGFKVTSIQTHSKAPKSQKPLTGFTSSRMEDLAMSPGFLAFFSAYCRSRSSRTLAASWSSSSSSLPKRSMSSSSSSSAAAGSDFLAGSSTFLEGTLNGSTFFTRSKFFFKGKKRENIILELEQSSQKKKAQGWESPLLRTVNDPRALGFIWIYQNRKFVHVDLRL